MDTPMTTNSPDIFSREALAGYEPDVLARASATIVGCGAAGNNVAINLALAGVAEMRFVDHDVVEPSNLTRSPLFDRRRIQGRKKRHKAREIALGALASSYASDPTVRHAVARIEELGPGALAGSGVVISAVDSLSARALLSDYARLMAVPLVEIGFSGHRGHVSVFPNRAAEEACWRCMHPDVSEGRGVSCALYARRVVEEGRTPATQPSASLFSSLAAELAIQALHGRFPIENAAVHFDLHTGRSSVVGVTPDERCPGAHRVAGDARDLAVSAAEPLDALFALAANLVPDPVICLPAAFVVEAPCARCGAAVPVGRPAWALREPPECRACPAIPQIGDAGALTLATVSPSDGLGRRRLRDLGLQPGAVFEIASASTAETRLARMAGTVDDHFTTRTRGGGNGAAGDSMKVSTAATVVAKE